MGRSLHLPNAAALAALDPRPRSVCLVVLMAVRDGGDAVRFEERRGAWVVFARRGGARVSYAPVHEAADVPRTLNDLT